MAHYIRFDVFIPVCYRVNGKDPKSGEKIWIEHSLPEKLVARFIVAPTAFDLILEVAAASCEVLYDVLLSLETDMRLSISANAMVTIESHG